MQARSQKPLIQSAQGQTPDRQPIWFLRQAGRYLPEYLAVRSKLSFVELCKDPDKAAEVTLQPLKRFDLDAAIIFSDILIPPTAMGQELTFKKDHGPMLSNPVRDRAGLDRLKIPDCQKELGYVGDAIAKTKLSLAPSQAMIGFSGAPFTVASYMIEGQGSKTYTETKRLMFANPEVFTGLMDKLSTVTIDYLSMQVKAGADALMIFDSWAGNLAPHHYRGLVEPHVRRIIQEVKAKHPETPVIYYPGQGETLYPEILNIPCDVVHIDWRTNLAKAIESFKSFGANVAVQGNLDPQFLLADHDALKQEVLRICNEGQSARGHIFNVGHGLMPHLDPDKIGKVIDIIRSH